MRILAALATTLLAGICHGLPLIPSSEVQVLQQMADWSYLEPTARLRDPGGWAPPWDCPEVQGVTCDEQGHVAAIRLHVLKFTGNLPENIGNLLHLTYLSLPLCSLNGSLPSSLGQLSMLRQLDLSYNSFAGTIPESFSAMTSLKRLDLKGNNLSGPIPEILGMLRNLTRLRLAANSLSGSIPTSLKNLLSLKQLVLSSNKLAGRVPPEIGALRSLGVLKLQNNQLTGSLPTEIGLLKELELLDASRNLLVGGVPSTLGNLRFLTAVNLSSNCLSDTLKLQSDSLVSLDLSHNRLTSGALLLNNLPNLESLAAANNSITGPLPLGSGARMTLLRSLDLSANNISGLLPISLSKLQWLSTLNFSGNAIEGGLKQAAGGWGLLHVLSMQGKDQGENVSEVLSVAESLPYLEHLAASSNLPEQNIPEAIGKLQSLSYLSVSAAGFMGAMPWSWSNLRKLKELRIEGTGLSGTLPHTLGLLSELSVLEVPGSLACPAPQCQAPAIVKSGPFCTHCAAFCATCAPYTNKAGLVALREFREYSQGKEAWDRNNLTWVEFINGSVSGIIDIELKTYDVLNVTSLALFRDTLTSLVLDFYFATMQSGIVPRDIGLLTSLQELQVGEITLLEQATLSHLRPLTGLTRLEFRTDGPFFESKELQFLPFLLGLRSLRELKVEMGSGEQRIPRGISRLSRLTRLDLSGNTFVGQMPASIGRLSNLTALDLRHLDRSVESIHPLVLSRELATLPLVQLYVDKGYKCPIGTCPRNPVYSDLPFCSTLCPKACSGCQRVLPYPDQPASDTLPPAPPAPEGADDSSTGGLSTGGVIAIAVGCAAVVLTCTVLTVLLVLRPVLDRDMVEKRGARKFRYAEVVECTRNFSSRLGAEGAKDGDRREAEVFKGRLASGQAVVIKRTVGMGRKAGAEERRLRNEVKVLSSLHHKNLVSHLGYCLHGRHIMLIYELVPEGSLRSLLRWHEGELTWQRRLSIATGAALGLDYLHSQIVPPIIHRDMTSANVMVTSDFDGKIGSFGVSAAAEETETEGGGEASCVCPKSTAQRAREGYVDPHTLRTGVPTTAGDVYSFGVVMLEIVTGWPAVEGNQHILLRVLQACKQDSGVMSVLAPALQQELSAATTKDGVKGRGGKNPPSAHSTVDAMQGVARFLALACKCCDSDPRKRPSMHHVACWLQDLGELNDGGQGCSYEGEWKGVVPFPEYDRPEGRPLTVTEILGGVSEQSVVIEADGNSD